MFIYSLSGLELSDSGPGGAVEVEDNETTARTAVYQTFGRLFLPPDDAHWDIASAGGWAKEIAEAGRLLSFAYDAGEQPVPDGDLAAHGAEYERLFATALEAAPWFDDTDRARDEVVRFYEYFGLATSAEARPIDHLVTECDFMQYTTYKEAVATSDRLRTSYRRAQLDFLDRHLTQWLPKMAAHAEEAGGSAFYRWAAGAAVRFAEADHGYVRALLA